MRSFTKKNYFTITFLKIIIPITIYNIAERKLMVNRLYHLHQLVGIRMVYVNDQQTANTHYHVRGLVK